MGNIARADIHFLGYGFVRSVGIADTEEMFKSIFDNVVFSCCFRSSHSPSPLSASRVDIPLQRIVALLLL